MQTYISFLIMSELSVSEYQKIIKELDAKISNIMHQKFFSIFLIFIIIILLFTNYIFYLQNINKDQLIETHNFYINKHNLNIDEMINFLNSIRLPLIR
jgi:hypothetical protein